MWPGIYKVAFEVMDAQGLTCPDPQKVDVLVCTCEDRVTCAKGGENKRTELGPAGIGMLFLGLLLLLRKHDVVTPSTTLFINASLAFFVLEC